MWNTKGVEESNAGYTSRLKAWKLYDLVTIVGIIIGSVFLEIGDATAPLGITIAGAIIMALSLLAVIYLI